MNKDNLKELWSNQANAAPKISEIYTKVSAFKRKKLLTMLATYIGLISVFLVCVIVFISFELSIMTQVGLLFIVLAILLFGLKYSSFYSNYQKMNNMTTNKEYLQNLRDLKKKHHYIETKIMSIYFVLLLMGICLYLYEFALMMGFPYAQIVYGLSLAWIAFVWFYLRPRIIRSNKLKINELIKHYSGIAEQLEE